MKVKADTIIRTICLALALTNQVLTAMGKPIINIADEDISLIITTGFTVVTAVWSWWKNNSFTKAALESDAYMEKLKENA